MSTVHGWNTGIFSHVRNDILNIEKTGRAGYRRRFQSNEVVNEKIRSEPILNEPFLHRKCVHTTYGGGDRIGLITIHDGDG